MYPMLQKSSKIRRTIMEDLPESRVCPSFCIQRTGIDFAGPFLMRLPRFGARERVNHQRSSAISNQFLWSWQRSQKEFRQLMKEDAVHQFLVTDNINFHFNPPSAPHFGGIWGGYSEIFTFHLNRVIGSLVSPSNYPRYPSQIEACLNSGPTMCII
ncbi:integrase catalytic domain-containing protein [Trichonephila clavipes]|nr:integrase catalytic domain-containing protein [Trichonephila clavipes]